VRVAYLDVSSGVSGDLFLGALADAGVPIESMQAAVDRLGIDGLRLTATRTERAGVPATKVDVTYPPQQEHRRLRHIVSLVEASSLTVDVKKRALAVFLRLAEVEAAVHGVDVEEVHFHEVGAADALADVVGSVAGLQELNTEALLVSSINVGSGHVRCAHGLLAVPAPATRGLLSGWTCHVAGPRRELTTPTGAALVTTLGFQIDAPPELRVDRTGCGAGGSDPAGWPNVLRLVVGEAPRLPSLLRTGPGADAAATRVDPGRGHAGR
jgi:pyridinium-3,5-bisthiocarboxylic acid mononucleotide nickel chelatase